MSIAVIIGTHGHAAEQLLKTAEMILGEQKNVSYIDFVPGENADSIFEKYQQQLTLLDCSKGVLFLVDMWGGSPFNAANRLATEHDNYEIISGVNIPMLLEVFMARDDDPSLSEITQTALTSGKSGIKAFRAISQEIQQTSSTIQQNIPNSTILTKNGHMVIALARIDDRLIHGQVATRWTKETNVKRIIVVSDEVAADNVRSALLKQAAPPGVSAHVVSVEKAINVYNNPKYANERVMLLFTNPTDVLKLINNNVDIKSINLGGMAFKQGKTQVSDAVSLDNNDIDAFNQLHNKGIELEFRKVSSDTKVDVMDLLKKV